MTVLGAQAHDRFEPRNPERHLPWPGWQGILSVVLPPIWLGTIGRDGRSQPAGLASARIANLKELS
jgi:hypothetical protein